jgi:hypothetical protein
MLNGGGCVGCGADLVDLVRKELAKHEEDVRERIVKKYAGEIDLTESGE